MDAQEIAKLEAEWKTDGLDADEIGERLRLMAEFEAEQAERTDDTEEEAADAEPESDDLTPRVAFANAEYVAAIRMIFGEEVTIEPCPYCHGLGFEAVDWPQDPHSQRCDSCKGLGRVVTGSFVEGNSTRTCTDCNGAGYRTEVVAPTPPTSVPSAPIIVPAFVAPPAA
jgi:DnaJ-class molecular chaperone